ncbi:hypothetical protein DXT99_11530 [Pontibacter diazotrophicus]|uniref:Glycosyltransferase subfamily 4-like N-terminal domain-containing protein n=1 Tax=Pontibacter diazotrophicus TaxID=1400979 RepID=A0A3D8LBY0_9BACT|nr:glycosyltransferase [Pontibacter diazotrophicus]RDV14918.1 hypothetical protein DXT99_11530 [Pontibacter diazotrophicus]
MSHLKVCYVIYGEEIWSPLLKRQVLELLQTAAGLDNRLSIRLLYIYPWFWQFTKKSHFKTFAKEFSAHPIELNFLPVPFPFPLPYFFPTYKKGVGFRPHEAHTGTFLWVLKLLVLPVLLKYLHLDKISIFHCRSYRAAAAVLALKNLHSRVKLVFDPRSDYPEENLIQNSWKKGSTPFRFWKRQERELLEKSSVTVCISEQYYRHYQKASPGFKHKVIPNNVCCSDFKFDATYRKHFRERYELEGKVVFCYLGTLGAGTWHDPLLYAQLILHFRAIANKHLFLFLIPHGSRSYTEKVFLDNGISDNEYLILSPAYAEVPKLLSAADFGLLYLGKEKIALGTKVVEYNAVGLPVLVNSNVLSAASYVQEHHTGMVIDIGLGDRDVKKTPVEGMDFQTLRNEFPGERIAQTARAHFSNEKVATEYVKIYQSLES